MFNSEETSKKTEKGDENRQKNKFTKQDLEWTMTMAKPFNKTR